METCTTHILNWNVRGLNDEAKQRAVRSKIEEISCTVFFCIKETKMSSIGHSIIKKLALKKFNRFTFAPSVGASGES
jgi:exonuclease III